MKQTNFRTILLLLMMTVLMPVHAEIYSGECGAPQRDNVKWELDTETGVLSITGNGAMLDFQALSSGTTNAGWSRKNYDKFIRAVQISDGVTNIGNFAFCQCYSLASITIPESVMSIGNYAFGECSSLASITLPESVNSIGESAFEGCSSLTSITIPESVNSIGESAFHNCNYEV